MSQANKELCRRVFEDVWNNRNLNAVDQYFAPNYTTYDPSSPDFGQGPEGYRKLVQYYLAAFPDTRFTIEDEIAEGDRVVIRWTVRGTHRGDLGGIAPTNRQVTLTGTETFRVSNGKIVETRGNWDAMGLMQQLGVMPARAAGRSGR